MGLGVGGSQNQAPYERAEDLEWAGDDEGGDEEEGKYLVRLMRRCSDITLARVL